MWCKLTKQWCQLTNWWYQLTNRWCQLTKWWCQLTKRWCQLTKYSTVHVVICGSDNMISFNSLTFQFFIKIFSQFHTQDKGPGLLNYGTTAHWHKTLYQFSLHNYVLIIHAGNTTHDCWLLAAPRCRFPWASGWVWSDLRQNDVSFAVDCRQPK